MLDVFKKKCDPLPQPKPPPQPADHRNAMKRVDLSATNTSWLLHASKLREQAIPSLEKNTHSGDDIILNKFVTYLLDKFIYRMKMGTNLISILCYFRMPTS